ncbi:hypothetical protein R1flu_009598 [Riccia fluitans]|uniref:Uncharacterized protein n=1 Tax=Riccia fluitans TaxID=41844 RepID=A0ABD1Z2L0_9MARC
MVFLFGFHKPFSLRNLLADCSERSATHIAQKPSGETLHYRGTFEEEVPYVREAFWQSDVKSAVRQSCAM